MQGCEAIFEDWFRGHWGVLIGIVVAVIVVEVGHVLQSIYTLCGLVDLVNK